MPNKHLATYTNDHVAGSVTALELLEYIASAYAGTEAEGIAKALWEEVAADRKELENLMGRLQIAQSPVRKASAWLAEKLTQLKLRGRPGRRDAAAARSDGGGFDRGGRQAPPVAFPVRRCRGRSRAAQAATTTG